MANVVTENARTGTKRRATPKKAAPKKAASRVTAKAKRPARAAVPAKAEVSAPAAEDYRRMVAEAAYFKAEKRGFAPGFEQQDWLEAENELKQAV
jgi:hypothetical protein